MSQQRRREFPHEENNRNHPAGWRTDQRPHGVLRRWEPLSTVESTVAAKVTKQAEPQFPLPAATDFAFEVVELKRSCLGSEGCKVTYTLRGSYIGTATIPNSESFRVLYEITGADDPKTGYVTWRNGHLYGDDEDFVSVSQGSVLQAT